MIDRARVTVRDRVYWSDVDKMDVMYYGKYLRFMERAEAAFFREHGFTYDALAEEHGIWLARVHVALDFRKPARLDDELTCWAELRKVGGASIHFGFPIECRGARLADATLVLSALDRATMKAVRIPVALKERLVSSQEPAAAG